MKGKERRDKGWGKVKEVRERVTKAGKDGEAVIGTRKKKKIHESKVLRYHYMTGEETRA